MHVATKRRCRFGEPRVQKPWRKPVDLLNECQLFVFFQLQINYPVMLGELYKEPGMMYFPTK